MGLTERGIGGIIRIKEEEMEYIDKPVCDSCGGKAFEITEIEKPSPETRHVPASEHFKPADYYSGISAPPLVAELTQRATCEKCGREYLY